MKARALFREGKLDDAIESLGVDLRGDPMDAQRRTFLFELLCFAGQFDRAEKQLDVLAKSSSEAAMGALLYQSALHAERIRQKMFQEGDYPGGGPSAEPVNGTLNGDPFELLEDSDPRIGARLEIFAAGQYMWIPFRQLASVQMAEPTRLRDLLWIPAAIRTGSEFRRHELGEVLIPVMSPLSWQDPDDQVRLGRVTQWVELENGAEVPFGQKLLLVDGDEFPILEVRQIEITPPSGQAD